jgi:hypothetical protein
MTASAICQSLRRIAVGLWHKPVFDTGLAIIFLISTDSVVQSIAPSLPEGNGQMPTLRISCL